MSADAEYVAKTRNAIRAIAASLAANKEGVIEEKVTLVDLIARVESLKADAEARGPERLPALAEWWGKVLHGALLDEVRDGGAVHRILSDFAERAAALVESFAQGKEADLPGAAELIARAAALLGEPAPRVPGGGGDETEAAPEGATRPVPPAEEGSGPAAGRAAEPTASSEVLDFRGTLFEEALIFEFIEECESHLDDIEPKILSLEEEPDNLSLVDEVFRPVHSIKGSAGFLQAKVIAEFAHQTENLLDEVRKKRIAASPPLCETLLRAIDVLKTMLAQLRKAAHRELGADPSRDPLPPVPVKQVLARIRAHMEGSPPSGGADPPSAKEAAGAAKKLGEILVEEGALTEEELETALSLQERPIGQVLIEEGLVPAGKVESALEKQDKTGARLRGSIKVGTEKIDDLVDLVGELVISTTLVRGRLLPPSAAGENGDGEGSGKEIDRLAKITKEIQDRIMSLRMVPLRPTFQKMARVVRDVSRKAGKKARLVLAGEDNELDKTVSEAIADPLVHIIRNSVDHGIEPAEERKAAGKNEVGTVSLSAFHEGGNIVIEISDDGRGLSRDKILKKAVERGLLEPGAPFADAHLHQLIMSPGFSTAEQVTDISGRGVGLDVVKKNIEHLRGRVEVRSREGAGSTFTIRLPLTLAIIDGMVVRAGREKFILPTLSIVQSFRPRPEDLVSMLGRGETVKVRGELLPLVRLHRLYGLSAAETDPARALAVVVENEGAPFALLVDRLLGQQQVVIKSLGGLLGKVKGVAGGTILGNGQVGLILDIGGIFAAYREAAPPEEMEAAAPPDAAPAAL